MLFHATEFIFLFVPVVLLLYLVALRFASIKLALGVLFLSSLFFYGYWDIRFVPLLLVSILFNYALATLMHQLTHMLIRRMILTLSIILNLGVLFYFKYALFVFDTLQSWAGSDAGFDVDFGDIILPIGISFYTFQQIAYQVDVYRSYTVDRSFLRYSVFVCFFPQLIAGPIVHHTEMMPQFRQPDFQRISHNIAIGLTIFTIGLAKKVILADSLALWSTPLFDDIAAKGQLSFFEAWGAALSYTLQIYFDFSGYSDMAIGLARMFGIVLPLNFSSPYKSSSIIEFWRRWHITLSRFLRDYLYIPLGGNQCNPLRRYANVVVTMVLGGIWHGSGWTFFVWGALHAAAISINHIWKDIGGGGGWRLPRVVGWTLVFLFIVIAWVPFRATDMALALEIWFAMAGGNGFEVPVALGGLLQSHPVLSEALNIKAVGVQRLGPEWLVVILTALTVSLLMPNTQTIMQKYEPGLTEKGYPAKGISVIRRLEQIQWRPSLIYAFLTAILFTLSVTWGNNISEFIYFQF